MALSADEAKIEYEKLEIITRNYLASVDVPTEIIDDMFRYSSNEIKLLSDEEFTQKIGIKRPYFDEWIISKCTELSSDEFHDLADILAHRITTGNKTALPASISKGYATYLLDKKSVIDNCKENAVFEHQKSILNL